MYIIVTYTQSTDSITTISVLVDTKMKSLDLEGFNLFHCGKESKFYSVTGIVNRDELEEQVLDVVKKQFPKEHLYLERRVSEGIIKSRF